jgi:hypothetical protein
MSIIKSFDAEFHKTHINTEIGASQNKIENIRRFFLQFACHICLFIFISIHQNLAISLKIR